MSDVVSIFTGLSDLVYIHVGGSVYYLPARVYERAHLRRADLGTQDLISIECDGLGRVMDADTIGYVISAMYTAVIPEIPVQLLPMYRCHVVDDLPRALAISAYCRIHLSPSAQVDRLRAKIRQVSLEYVNIVRALTTPDDSHLDGSRYDILQDIGHPIGAREVVDSRYLVPVSSDSLDRVRISLDDLNLARSRILWEILSRELKIISLENPQYMRVPNFGNRSAGELREILAIAERTLHYHPRPDADICDVMQYGLTIALETE